MFGISRPTAKNVFPMVAAGKGLTDMIPAEELCAENSKMRHIISILIENEAGALSRVPASFPPARYNIETLTVAPTEDSSSPA